MKTRIASIVVALSSLTVGLPALAADAASAPRADQKASPQQSRMKTCNAEAQGKKGDERRTFMKECLAGKKDEGRAAQQDRMKACNAEAQGKTGDARKAFIKECLVRKA